MVDYFAVLGLKRSASDAEIRDAYRRLAKLYHPDSNPTDPEGARRMQAVNEAKTVLFDPVKREEHRVMLGLREKLTAERLAQLRAETRPIQYQSSSSVKFKAPPSKWDLVWRKWLMGVVAASMIFIVGLTTYEVTRTEPVIKDPIREIIARYNSREILPFDSAISEIDTMYVADDTLPRLKRHGDILFNFGEYKSAAKYYERYLQHDTTDESVITNLSFAYFKRGKYAQSLEVLSKQMHGDSTLVVTYYNIGELFLKEEKPLDARNAFEAAIKVGDDMRAHGRIPSQFLTRARTELARLE